MLLVLCAALGSAWLTWEVSAWQRGLGSLDLALGRTHGTGYGKTPWRSVQGEERVPGTQPCRGGRPLCRVGACGVGLGPPCPRLSAAGAHAPAHWFLD